MKKSELKKFIKEEIKKLIEQKAMMGGPLTHPIADTEGRYEITINSTGETIPLTGNPIESLISIASNMRGLERYSPEERALEEPIIYMIGNHVLNTLPTSPNASPPAGVTLR